MGNVAVKRLAVSTPAGRTAEARMRVEDALRMASLGDDRLFIFRQFDFGVLPQAARSTTWQSRAETKMRSLVASAVHASAPGAAQSHAVWFRSQNEAQTLLLALLAKGIAPTAWFWRLAIGDWQGASLSEWLPRLFERARNDETQRVAIARALVTALSEDGGAAVMAALNRLPDIVQSQRPIGINDDNAYAQIHGQEENHRRLAAAVIGRHSPALQRQFARILLDTKQVSNARYWLAIIAIVAVGIELETNRALLNAIVAIIQTEEFWQQFAPSGPSAGGLLMRDSGKAPIVMALGETEPTVPGRIASKVPLETASRNDNQNQYEVQAGEVSPHIDAMNAEPDAARLTAPGAEFVSANAGLWLLVPALYKMGLADWLNNRNSPEFSSFGHALLAHIAQRQGVKLEDPALSPIWLDSELSDERLTAWRVGLDRWLRRHAQIRLCDIVKKRGWLRQVDASVTIRFLPEDADIRLRRKALDLDPGWVSWLGLAVAYEYRERRFT